MVVSVPKVYEIHKICGCITWKFGRNLSGRNGCWMHELIYRICEEPE